MYYLYQHKDKEGNVFYIGKGTKDAYHSAGYSRAYSKAERTKSWKEIADNGYSVEIIKESLEEQNIIDEEIFLIQECPDCVNKRKAYNTLKYKFSKVNEELVILTIFKPRFQCKYLLFDTGVIFNMHGKKLIPRDNNNGYKCITTHVDSNIDNKQTIFYIHRLVAEAFIPNPLNLPIVNHKDRDRANNGRSNLEWGTQKDNIQHALNLGSFDIIERRKPVLQFKLNGEFLKEWPTCKEASIYYKCTKELIQQVASVKNKNCFTAKGYLWIYKKDYDNNKVTKINRIIEKVKQKL